MLISAVAGMLGLVVGLVCAYLGLLWAVLYNTAGGTDPYVRALIFVSWICSITWVCSSIQFAYSSTAASGLAFFVIIVVALLGDLGLGITEVREVPVKFMFDFLFVPFAISWAFCVAVAMFVLPESSTEATRESAVFAVGSLRDVFVLQTPSTQPALSPPRDPETHRTFLLTRMRNDLASLEADVRGCLADTHFLRDSPTRIAAVAERIRALARHSPSLRTGSYMASGANPSAVPTALQAVHEALVIDERPPWDPAFWNYVREPRLHPSIDPAELLNRATDELAKEKAALACCTPLGGDSPADLDRFVTAMAVDAAAELVDSAMDLVATRTKGYRFYLFGNPGKPARKQKQRPLPDPYAAQPHNDPAPWPPVRIFFSALYAFQNAMASDAARFGFKRALAFFLISVWAFLPEYATFFKGHHVFWMLMSVLALMTPTIGAGVAKSLFRLLATAFAALWAYFTYLAAAPTPATTAEDYLRVALPMYAPLSVLLFYGICTFPRPYASRMAAFAYVAVALSGDPAKAPQFAWERTCWVLAAAAGAMFLQIACFPTLAATEVRVGLGNFLYGLGRAFRGLQAGRDPALLRSELDALQTRLTALRLGPLAESAGEPNLDRPFSLPVTRGLVAASQRLLLLAGVLADARRVSSEPPRRYGALADLVVWKLHSVAMALVTAKPLPRLPMLSRAAADPLPATTLPVAGGEAALRMTLAELDVVEELVKRVWGREATVAELGGGGGWAGAWPMAGAEEAVAVLETKGVGAG
ncbi:hypothetical protein DFJ74DRAFT_289543 [Hyaloraphidium curvatum]|nr:hypothetical protein DFJ74DRAFT_289543 [Hyaloraphidium curvatum]